MALLETFEPAIGEAKSKVSNDELKLVRCPNHYCSHTCHYRPTSSCIVWQKNRPPYITTRPSISCVKNKSMISCTSSRKETMACVNEVARQRQTGPGQLFFHDCVLQKHVLPSVLIYMVFGASFPIPCVYRHTHIHQARSVSHPLRSVPLSIVWKMCISQQTVSTGWYIYH